MKHLLSAFGVMVNFAGSYDTENCHFLYETAGSGFKAVVVHISAHKYIFPTPFTLFTTLS